jgi:hypothetical protein
LRAMVAMWTSDIQGLEHDPHMAYTTILIIHY